MLLLEAQDREELVPRDLLAKTQTILGNKQGKRSALCPKGWGPGPDFYPLLIEKAWSQCNSERHTDVKSLLADSRQELFTSLESEAFMEMGQIQLPSAL